MAKDWLNYSRDITMGPTWAEDATSMASDTVDLKPGVRSLIVSVSCVLRLTLVDMEDGSYVDYPAAVVPAGRFVAQIKRLWSAGTTATVVLIEG